jgi:Kdo2-lipid IVA lauroyltransferase/acyltransferase
MSMRNYGRSGEAIERFEPTRSGMLIPFLKFISRVPMRWYHAVGVMVGWCGYRFARREASRLRENLRQSKLWSTDAEYHALLKESVTQAGKSVTEWFKGWYAPKAEFDRLCQCHSWDVVDNAQRRGKGIIFLLPHLGSFPIATRYTGQRLPLTLLYRPPRESWRLPIMLSGGENVGITMAPTDFKGIEMLLRALKRGEGVGLPPDQAPNSDGGVWSDFFGKPAYTMTLARKLHRATGAALIGCFAERLPRGQGYRLHYRHVREENFDERALNAVIEEMVRSCPGQYNWSYNRYKTPRAAMKKKISSRFNGSKVQSGYRDLER